MGDPSRRTSSRTCHRGDASSRSRTPATSCTSSSPRSSPSWSWSSCHDHADSEGPVCRNPSAPSFRTLRHGRIGLALHQLRPGAGRPLLLLHGLGEQSPTEVPAASAAWPGPVCALDFTGHGRSDAPRGGGYTAEILMGDVDAALGAPRRGDDPRSRARRVRRAARRRRPAHPGPRRGAGRRSRSGRGRSQPRVAVARAPARGGEGSARPVRARSSWPATSGRRTTRSPTSASRCSSRGSTTRSRSRRPFGPRGWRPSRGRWVCSRSRSRPRSGATPWSDRRSVGAGGDEGRELDQRVTCLGRQRGALERCHRPRDEPLDRRLDLGAGPRPRP